LVKNVTNWLNCSDLTNVKSDPDQINHDDKSDSSEQEEDKEDYEEFFRDDFSDEFVEEYSYEEYLALANEEEQNISLQSELVKNFIYYF
jgi:hypothetical protein